MKIRMHSLDSQYAGNIATGAWRAKANRELAARVQSVWNEVASQRELSWNHVRAHRGHRWNERADHLAKRAMRRERPYPSRFGSLDKIKRVVRSTTLAILLHTQVDVMHDRFATSATRTANRNHTKKPESGKTCA